MESKFELTLKCISMIPEFTGEDSSQLPQFIKQVQALQTLVLTCSAEEKTIVFVNLLSRFSGKARQVINGHDEINDWTELKEVLKANFGEKKRMIHLIDELKFLRMNGSIEKFYEKIGEIVSRIDNRRLTSNEDTYTINDIARLALKIFQDNLPNLPRNAVVARKPNTLKEAYEIVVECGYENFTKFESRNGDILPNSRKQNFKRNNYNRNNNNFNNNNTKDNHNAQNNSNEYSNTSSNSSSNIRTSANSYNNYNNGYNNRNNFANNNTHNTNNFRNRNNYNNNNSNNYNSNNSNNYRNNNNNNNINNNNSNNYNNNNNNYRQQNNSTQSRHSQSFGRTETMEIGQLDSDFHEDRQNNYPT